MKFLSRERVRSTGYFDSRMSRGSFLKFTNDKRDVCSRWKVMGFLCHLERDRLEEKGVHVSLESRMIEMFNDGFII